MKTITKNLYTFGELLEQAKVQPDDKRLKRAIEKAREWLQEGATNYDWWDYIYEKYVSACNQIGFTDAEFSFSGFWSQGDGASFTCRHVDLKTLAAFLSNPPVAEDTIKGTNTGEDFGPWLVHQCSGVIKLDEAVNLIDFDYLTASVDRSQRGGHYVHERTCSIEFDNMLRDADEQAGWVKLLEESAEQLRRDICHAIYRALEAEYEWRREDEQLIEDSDSNEYTFDESGRREG